MANRNQIIVSLKKATVVRPTVTTTIAKCIPANYTG